MSSAMPERRPSEIVILAGIGESRYLSTRILTPAFSDVATSAAAPIVCSTSASVMPICSRVAGVGTRSIRGGSGAPACAVSFGGASCWADTGTRTASRFRIASSNAEESFFTESSCRASMQLGGLHLPPWRTASLCDGERQRLFVLQNVARQNARQYYGRAHNGLVKSFTRTLRKMQTRQTVRPITAHMEGAT